MSVTCYEILNAGEGDRGRKIPVNLSGALSTLDYVKVAARILDDHDMRQQGADNADVGAWHGGVHYIEVEGHPWHPEPVRYAVRCEVIRSYSACLIERETL